MMIDEADLRNKVQAAYTALELLKEGRPVSREFAEIALRNLKEIFQDPAPSK